MEVGTKRRLTFGKGWITALSILVIALVVFYVTEFTTKTQVFASVLVQKVSNSIVLKGYVKESNLKPDANVVINVNEGNKVIAHGKTNADGYFQITLKNASRENYTISWDQNGKTIKKDVPLLTSYWQNVESNGGLWTAPKKGETIKQFEKDLMNHYGLTKSQIHMTKNHHVWINWKNVSVPNQEIGYKVTVTKTFTLLGFQTFAY